MLLVLNAGSSSLKGELFDDAEQTVWRGTVGRIGSEAAYQETKGGDGRSRRAERPCPDHDAALGWLLEMLRDTVPEASLAAISAVGHRVVHGGPDLSAPVRVDDAVLATLAGYNDLAPLHNGPAVAAMQAARRLLPDAPHVAVFDTGFHHDLPAVARIYALPAALSERWALRRYGFHGISCEYLVGRVAELGIAPARRTLICHLGAGASVTAVLDGRSRDTSMGFTPLEGLVMGTRCGDLDPGLLLYLERQAGLTGDALDQVLQHESGLRGLSGRTDDYAELERLARDGDTRASFALENFSYRVRKYLGAYWAALGGVDLVVFAGGIGENSAGARERILAPLATVGWQLDLATNAAGPPERAVSPPGAQPGIWVIPTRETLQIARHVRTLVGG
jgi:acetate kinase